MLNMSQERYFYSPDAGTNWVGPFTQHELNELRAAGIIQPSFAVRSEAENAGQISPPPRSEAKPSTPTAQFTDVPLVQPGQPSTVSVPPSNAFYVMIGEQQIGPIPVEQLEQMVTAGQVTDASMVWTAGLPQWLPYGQVKQTLPPPRQTQESLAGKGKRVAQKMMDTVVKVNSMISTAADLHKLENFSWKKFFGEVFRKHPDEDVYAIFQCGTPTSTPSIEQVVNEWPSPWMFSRFLFCGLALFIVFAWLIEKGMFQFVPFYCVTGALFFPLALYILFFELNIWRNISMYNAVRCITIGGIVALVMMVLEGEKLDRWYLHAPILEYIKLQATLLIGAHLVKIRMNRILPGMLLGCAVGGGLAVIECTASLFRKGDTQDIVVYLIGTCLYAFLQVVWAVITAGAFCKVQAMREHEHDRSESAYATMLDVRFLSVVAVPLILHFLLDCLVRYSSESPWFGLTALAAVVIFSILSWWIVMRLIQRGIDQVREEKERAMSATPPAPQESGPMPPPQGTV